MFLALRYNCVLLKKDMHHLKNIWFFYHLPKFENELTQTYLSFNYQFFNYCVMSTWLLLCRDVSLPLHTFLNLEVEYSKASLKHFFTYNYIFFIHDLPGCNSPKTEVASAPSHVSRKTRAHPIVHEFEYNLHIHWFRVQPTLSRQNQPLLNMTDLELVHYRTIGNHRLSPLCSMWETPRSRSSKCAQSGSLHHIVAVL